MMLRIVTFALATVMAASAMSAELLMFEEDGCIWCARWDAEVAPAYARSAEARLAPLVRYDLRRDPLPDGLALKGRVRYTPTFVLVEDGREIGRITGYPGETAFWAMLGELVGQLETETPPSLDTARSARRALSDG